MAKKTGFDDIFSGEFGKYGIAQLEKIAALAKEIKEDLKASATALSKDIKSTQFKSGEDVQKFTTQKAQAKVVVDQFTQAEKAELIINQKLIDARKESAVQIEKLRMQLKAQTQANKEAAGAFTNVSTKIRENTKALYAMAEAGKKSSEEYKKLKKETADMVDKVGDLKAELRILGDETKNIQGVVGTLNLMAAGFQVAEGASALLGVESEELQKTFVKLQALMAVTNGLEQIGNLLKRESAAMLFLQSVQTKAAAAATTLYAFATGGATTATKALRVALLATGIGAVIVLVASLAGAMGDLADSEEDAAKEAEHLADVLENQKIATESRIALIEREIQRREGGINQTKREIELLKAKGKNSEEVFAKEQHLRNLELEALKRGLIEFQDSDDRKRHLSQETIEQKEKIANKENEIEVARTLFEKEELKKRTEAQKKHREAKEKELKDELDTLRKNSSLRTELLQDGIEKDLQQEELRFAREYTENENNKETLELLEKVHQKNIQDIKDRYAKEEQDKYQEKIDAISQKRFDDAEAKKKLEDEITAKEKAAFEQRKQNAQKAVAALQQLSQSLLQSKLSAIDSELNASEKRENDLKALAQQGSLNAQQSIALEQKRQAELKNNKEKAIKKQREQAFILAGLEAFIAAAKSGSTTPGADASKQVGTFVDGLKGALEKLKGFAKGGKIKGGEQIVKVNEEGEEFVVKNKALKKYGEGMLYDINEGRFNPLDYMSTPTSEGFRYSSNSTEVVQEIRGLRQEVKNKPVPFFEVSGITGGILAGMREGNNVINKHYQKANKLF